ncbi:MAG TPA: hypothetical protein VL860_10520, partial [Planctomycetota bacterium]|nr:hypothetical protein [Planctomycetota bacterium]
CTPYQWERACRGQAMGRFPYGSRFDPACLTPGLAQCQSSYGVYDQLGQAPEWVMTTVGQPQLNAPAPQVMGGVLAGEDPADADCLGLRGGAPVKAPVAGTAKVNEAGEAVAEPVPAAAAAATPEIPALAARVRCCSAPASRSAYILDYDR